MAIEIASTPSVLNAFNQMNGMNFFECFIQLWAWYFDQKKYVAQ